MASDMRLSEPSSNDGNLMKGMDERARKNGSLAMGKEDNEIIIPTIQTQVLTTMRAHFTGIRR